MFSLVVIIFTCLNVMMSVDCQPDAMPVLVSRLCR
jgi:protoheme IX farnesyltransferase